MTWKRQSKNEKHDEICISLPEIIPTCTQKSKEIQRNPKKSKGLAVNETMSKDCFIECSKDIWRNHLKETGIWRKHLKEHKVALQLLHDTFCMVFVISLPRLGQSIANFEQHNFECNFVWMQQAKYSEIIYLRGTLQILSDEVGKLTAKFYSCGSSAHHHKVQQLLHLLRIW